MKKRCAGLLALLLLLVAIGLGNPVMFNGGVIDSRTTVTRMDSAKLAFRSYEDMTFLTPGWGAEIPYDTLVFAGAPPAWPESIRLYGTVNSFPAYTLVPNPRPDIWYRIGMGVVTSYVEFGEYPDPGGVEESKPSPERPPRLAVSPSVVTGQMKVRLQPVGTGRAVVEIHDAVGNVIRSLDCAAGADGITTATWNREEDGGRLVPEGVYFCRYAGADVIAVRKVLVAH